MEDNTCKIGEKFSGAWARRNGWGTLGIYRAATICRAFTGRPLFSQHPPSLLIALWPAAFFVLFSPLHCRIRLLLFDLKLASMVVLSSWYLAVLGELRWSMKSAPSARPQSFLQQARPGLTDLIHHCTVSIARINSFFYVFLDQTCSFDNFQFTDWMWDLILGSRFWMRFWIGIQSSYSAPTLCWLLTIVFCFWMRFCIKWYTMDDLMLCSNVGCFVLTKVFTK